MARSVVMLCFVLASTRIAINSTTLIKHHLSLGIFLHYYYQTNEKSINRYTIIATKGGIKPITPLHESQFTRFPVDELRSLRLSLSSLTFLLMS